MPAIAENAHPPRTKSAYAAAITKLLDFYDDEKETARALRAGVNRLHKDFPVWTEGRRIEFRGEFFNLFNRTNFGVPNSTRSASAFGTIRSTWPARMIQLALKFVF